MADEVGSAALQSGQKVIEVSAELVKLLAPLAEKLLSTVFHKSVNGINGVGGKIADATSKGTVTNKGLLVEAQKAGCGISTTSNVLSMDAENFVQKAKQYNIPVAVVGKGDKQTIEFLDRDKGVIDQITQEIMQERLKEAPQSVKSFNISENNVTAMKNAFEEHGIACQFMKSADGKIKCVYPAEEAEQVAVIKNDYKQMHKEVADNLDIQVGENETLVADNELGKSFVFTPMNKAQTMQMLQEQFGYSEAKADLAANKICRDLGLDKKKFFANTQQYDNLNSLKTNIRYQSDDLTLRDVRFDAVNFKDGGTTHIVIQNGDKSAALTPDRMTETEMMNICTNQLGMSEYQAQKAVEKSTKINRQVNSQIEERGVSKDGISHTVQIERSTKDTFLVRLGDKSKTYNFNTINVADKVARDFNIPKENAQRIVEKAKQQSALQNKIQNVIKKKKKAAPEAPKLNLNNGKGLKH
ncbi:MAG: hypothetical protein ACI4J7_09505 [Ruminiclostridium sp.]